MSYLSRFLLAACAAATLLLPGCGGGSNKGPVVAFVTNNADPFWNLAQAGAEARAAEEKVTLIFRKPSPGSVAQQKQEIENAINKGAKAVTISVIDPKNQTGDIDEYAAKVHVLTQDNDAPNSKRLAYIGTENYKAGRAAGKLVREALGDEGGTVAIFVGRKESLNARQRRQGVIDELAGRPAPKDVNDPEYWGDGEVVDAPKGKIKFHDRTFYESEVGEKEAQANAENFLNKRPKAGNICMVGLWAYNPPACLAAADGVVKDKADRARIKIVGFDERPQTLDAIKAGTIYGTIVQDPFGFGYESVKIMAALARGDKSLLPKDGILHLPYRVIQKEAGDKAGEKRIAVDDFKKQLDERLGKK
jgi:ribose transport system substrate-binding protein